MTNLIAQVLAEREFAERPPVLVDVGAAAYKAAKAKNMDGINALNQQLNDACVTCHQDYRPNYRRRTPAAGKQ